MSDNGTIERGDQFVEHSDPHVDEMVVLETGQISGYRGVRVAEEDTQTGNWRAYWMKASYLHDELNLGSASRLDAVDESYLESVERQVQADRKGTPNSPEQVKPVASLD